MSSCLWNKLMPQGWAISASQIKDGTNREYRTNRISSRFLIRIEYSMASNSIRILNTVEMSCLDLHGGIIPCQLVVGIVVIRIDLFVEVCIAACGGPTHYLCNDINDMISDSILTVLFLVTKPQSITFGTRPLRYILGVQIMVFKQHLKNNHCIPRYQICWGVIPT